MQAIVPLLLSILEEVAPGAATTVIEKVINLLVALIPILIQEYKDLLPIVQNIIVALQQSDDISDAQWDALDAMSAQIDAAFQAALEAAKAQDAAVNAAKPV